ncbi:hypothetical protein SH661x_001535 [Planctomicrobium sp. SH661]|uniref:hypothetical protein n=1 Tax=Planctomicrobium sp. SH661 TaxID=3448124 RepID=UPI003F5B2428
MKNPASSTAGLAECVKRLHAGPWTFVQLRGETVNGVPPDGDDIDLLGTRESVHTLLQQAFNWVREGLCHARVRSQTPDKVEFTLFSRDGSECIRFDLWIHLRQLDRGQQQMQFEDCRAAFVESSSAIKRLQVMPEACLYVQHLLTKSKNLKASKVQQRLDKYVSDCRAAGEGDLAAKLLEIRQKARISEETERQTLQLLQGYLRKDGLTAQAGNRSQRTSSWLVGPRKPRHISIIGCDGAGKTTLAEHVAKQRSQTRTYTGKHLYRKAMSYKAAVIFVRPLLRQSRELFDETLAPWVYLRAAAALRLRTMFPTKRTTLIDRSLLDFLFINRKTDQPEFCRTSWLAGWFGQRIPTIHCIVQYANVLKRKQEVSAAGHACYDESMFQQFTSRIPTDYVAFNNDGSLADSASALNNILDVMQEKPVKSVRSTRAKAA